MGADLYIESLFQKNNKKYNKLFHEATKKREALSNSTAFIKGVKDIVKAKEKAQKEVEKYYDLMYSKGYFRDSYNLTSVLWTFKMSWWNNPFIKRNVISPANAKKFIEVLKTKKQIFPTEKELIENGVNVKEKGNGVKDWEKFYKAKSKSFIKFLEQAIKLNENIRASV